MIREDKFVQSRPPFPVPTVKELPEDATPEWGAAAVEMRELLDAALEET